MVTVPALVHRLRGTSLSYGPPVMDLGKWGIPVNLIAVVMGGLLVINIGWPRAEVYDVAGAGWFMQYFALIFVAATLIVGYLAYRVVRDRERRAGPDRRAGRQEEVTPTSLAPHLFGAQAYVWAPKSEWTAPFRRSRRGRGPDPGPDAMAPLPRSTEVPATRHSSPICPSSRPVVVSARLGVTRAHPKGVSPAATRMPSPIRLLAESCSRSPASRCACPARYRE